MKKLIIIGLLIVAAISVTYAQTVISPSTTVLAFSAMNTGQYRFINSGDTVYFNKDTLGIKIVSITVHDTIPKICPVCKVFSKADTVAIQALKICPPPIICPACPPIPKQRTATGISWDIILNKKTITYDNGTTSTL